MAMLQLVEQFPLRPIRSASDLAKATAVAGRLAVNRRLTRDEQDYLDVLSDLIERYEDEHHRIEPRSGSELLAFLLQENGLSQAQLARETGIAKSTLCAVLNGKLALSVAHVTALGRRFRLEPGAFLTVE
jgi:HTH-type transcriptional regulator/antitoxin HigA